MRVWRLKAGSAFVPDMSRVSRREGWDLWTRDDGRLELQRLDTRERFHSDAEAVAYVVRRALRGSRRHLLALYLDGRRVGDAVDLMDRLVLGRERRNR